MAANREKLLTDMLAAQKKAQDAIAADPKANPAAELNKDMVEAISNYISSFVVQNPSPKNLAEAFAQALAAKKEITLKDLNPDA